MLGLMQQATFLSTIYQQSEVKQTKLEFIYRDKRQRSHVSLQVTDVCFLKTLNMAEQSPKVTMSSER